MIGPDQVIAGRTDGLGGRAMAIVNGMWLADRLGAMFGFAWTASRGANPEREIPNAELVFSRDFLREHHRQAIPDSSVPVHDKGITKSWLASQSGGATHPRPLAMLVCQDVVALDGITMSAGEFRSIWKRIGWSPWLRTLEVAAQKSIPPGAVALHVRRGDIVYGEMRRGNYFDKVYPIAWLRRIAEQLAASGHSVVVFGDTATAVELVADGLPLVLAARLLPPGLTGFEASFFELAAMAACGRIVGANSVFSVLAGKLGGTGLELAEHLIPHDQRIPLALEALAARPQRYDRLAMAYEHLWLALWPRSGLTIPQRYDLLEEARSFDPDNEAIDLARAKLDLTRADYDSAEQRLASVAASWQQRGSRPGARLFPVGSAREILRHEIRNIPAGMLAKRPHLLRFREELALPGDRRPKPERTSANTGLFGAPLRSEMSLTSEEELTRLIAELRPVVSPFPLVRIGPMADGGYLLPDDFKDIVGVVSGGIGNNAGFDLALARRGLPVVMTDRSILNPPVLHPRFRFIRKHIGSVDSPETVTLSGLLQNMGSSDGDLILKLDIEGAEYEALSAASVADMVRFRTIVVELHDLDKLAIAAHFGPMAAAIRKLTTNHAVVHIHPNNCAKPKAFGAISLPPVMEFTLYRRDRLADQAHWQVEFPHTLDVQNVPRKDPVLLPFCWFT